MGRIADDLHNVLWGGGQHQNELFFNLIALFLTKICDEKTKADGEPYGFQILYKGNEKESAESVYSRINTLYKGVKDKKQKSTPNVP
ncbi:MAG: hypothetical protein KBI01_08865 [Oscillospiraceae bacterium]|nr:hypothetical protein [Oscillospiraceae bacterium]